MKISSLALLATFSTLVGCAVPAGGYRATPTTKLCMDYLTFPSYNINQNERANELARRGESCQGYAGVAQVRNQANAQFENSLRYMQQQSQPVQTSPTRTYIMPNGKVTNCTTTGTVTNCF